MSTVLVFDKCRLFAPFEGHLFDAIGTYRAYTRPVAAEVCLVYVPVDKRADVQFNALLLKRLQSMKPRAVAFVDDGVSRKTLAAAKAKTKEVFFPCPSNKPGGDYDGAIDLLPTEFGIYRYHYGNRRDAAPGLEWQVARHVLVGTSELPSQQYFGIRFRGDGGSLPNVSADDVVKGEITKGFFRRKAVLIGSRPNANEVGISVPTSGGKFAMSPVELHGHCLNSLLTKTWIARVSTSWRVLCYALCLVVTLTVFHHSTYAHMWVHLVGCVLVVVCTSFVALFLFDCQLPLVGMLLCQFSVVAASLVIRFRRINRTLELLEVSRTSTLQDNGQRTYWAEAGDLIFQLYYCNRVVILELPVGSNYLKVVHTINCNDGELAEERRDFRRAPYSDAASAHHPFELDSATNSFFTTASPDEQQLVVPLLVAGNVVAFMIVAVSASTYHRPEFTKQLQKIADDLALAIDTRRRAAYGTSKKRLSFFPEQAQLEKILRDDRLQSCERTRLDEIIEGSSTAAATFDVYGCPIVVNQRMRELLKERGIVLTDATLLRTIHELSQHDWDTCRRHLRRIFFTRVPQTIVVPADKNNGLAVLHLRPLDEVRLKKRAEDDISNPFSISGVHVEFSNESAWQSVVEDRQRVVRQLCESMFDTLESVRETSADHEHKDEFDRILEAAAADLAECQSFLADHRELSAQSKLPVDLKSLLETVIAAVETELEAVGVRLLQDSELVGCDVLANPKECATLFETLMRMAIREARTNSTIRLATTSEGGIVTISLENSRLAEYLVEHRDAANLTAVQTDELVDFARWVQAWGGNLVVVQVVGIGLRITLSLQTHRWDVCGATLLPPD
ncbi:MAG: CHASE2 domain-containing protein [Planctomycetales bacterium]|nr:CHASE2 domain-containing protein [Planctomycetales bacterium]